MEEQQDQNPAATDPNIEDKGAAEAKPAVKDEAENEPASGEKKKVRIPPKIN